MDEPRQHGRELSDAEVARIFDVPGDMLGVRPEHVISVQDEHVRVGLDQALDGTTVPIYESSKHSDPAVLDSWRRVGQVRMPEVEIPEVRLPTPLVKPEVGERLARSLERMAERVRDIKIEPGSGMDKAVKALTRRMDEVETPDPRVRALRAKAAQQNHGPVGKRRRR